MSCKIEDLGLYNDAHLLYLLMETKELIADSLNQQQILMLRLLKNPLPEASFTQIRQLAVRLLSEQLNNVVEKWEVQNNITEKNYEELSEQHFRSSSKKQG